MRSFFQKLWATFRFRDLDQDLDTELASHLELLTEEYARKGLPPEEARRQARIELGGVQQLREAHRRERGLPLLETLVQDLRYTFRMLRQNPGFTAFTILIVGLGVGASSTIFSVVNTLLLRPLPFRDSQRMVWISGHGRDDTSEYQVQVGHYLDLKEQNRSFSDITAYNPFNQPGNAKITGDGESERLSSMSVTQNFFSFLGINPWIGRTFTADECKWNAPRAAMLTYAVWKRRYASDPSIIGRQLRINDSPVTIVGVLPESFDFSTVFTPGARIDLFRPMPLTDETDQMGNTLAVIGRLKPGTKMETALVEMQTLSARFQKEHPERNGFEPRIKTLERHVTGRIRQALLVLAWAVGIVMLIVCANVANLQLARTAARQKEMAIRAAIGASRGRLIRQMLTESLVLSCCGAALGVFLAMVGVKLLSELKAFSIPLLSTIQMDASALAFSLLVAIVTGLLFGLAPALQVPSFSVHDSLKDTSRSTGSRHHIWIRSTLVVSEIVFACVLLVGAGLLARSFLKLMEVDLGFKPEHAAAVRIDPNRSYSTRAMRNGYYDEVLARVRSLPGVTGAGLAEMLPLAGDRSWQVLAKGKVYSTTPVPEAFVRFVTDGYIASMGIPLRSGRDLSAADVTGSELVVLINETMARTVWAGENPIGQMIQTDGRANPPRRVVGVVADVKHQGLENVSGNEVYEPIRQTDSYSSVYLVVRSAIPPSALASSVRGVLRPLAPELSGSEFKTIQQLVDTAVSPRRFVVGLLGGFSIFALVLAALGIYAVISYSVAQRTAELRIRMALGASAGDLQARIMMQTLRLAALGVLIGSAVSWSLGRALGSLLFGITFTDPVTFVGMMIVLTAVALLAGYVPSLRVSGIDPIKALRTS